MEIRRIHTMRDFSRNQYLILTQLEKVKSFYPEGKNLIEQEKCRELIFLSLLLCGEKGIIEENILTFTFKEGDSNAAFTISIDKLKKYAFAREALHMICEERNAADERAETERQAVLDHKIMESLRKDAEDQQQMEQELKHTEEVRESIIVPSEEKGVLETLVPQNSEIEAIPSLGFPLESKDMPHAETSTAKYLDTMWFEKIHLLCTEKDSFSPMEFELMIYPLEKERDRIPVSLAVGLQHGNSFKLCFSDGPRKSLQINYEDYIFTITARFVDGRFLSNVTLASPEYIIQDKEIIRLQESALVPEHFGKCNYFGEDKLEVFPLDIVNDDSSGCVPFMYRFWVNHSDKPDYGFSDRLHSALLGLSGGGSVDISCYWEGKESERKFVLQY